MAFVCHVGCCSVSESLASSSLQLLNYTGYFCCFEESTVVPVRSEYNEQKSQTDISLWANKSSRFYLRRPND